MCVCVAEVLSLSYTSRVGELGEMCLLAGVLTVQTVICKNKTTEITFQSRNLDHGLCSSGHATVHCQYGWGSNPVSRGKDHIQESVCVKHLHK